jgi:hypothetical protein
MFTYRAGRDSATFLYWMALRDIQDGYGVTVIDGGIKRDLIDNLLRSIPEKYKDKTVLLDIENPLPFDFMSVEGETPRERDRSKEYLISQIKFLISRGIDTQYGYSVDANLENVIRTLLNYNDNQTIKPNKKATFLDIYWFLDNWKRREEIKAGLTDQRYIAMWREPIPRVGLTAQDIGRITGRMNAWASSPTLQAIFGVPSPPLRIEDCYNEERILLVNLNTDEISGIYGTLLISKLWEVAKRQRKKRQKDRLANFLFCDEFQNFQTKNFEEIITEGGGLGLCLTMANQFLEDDRIDNNVRKAITEVCSNFVIFCVGDGTARILAPQIPSMEKEAVRKINPYTGEREIHHRPVPFDHQQLVHLPKFKVLWRKADDTAEFKPTTKWPRFDVPVDYDQYAEDISLRTEHDYHCEPLELSYDLEDGPESPVVGTGKDGGPPNSKAPKRTAHKDKKPNA